MNVMNSKQVSSNYLLLGHGLPNYECVTGKDIEFGGLFLSNFTTNIMIVLFILVKGYGNCE